MIYLDHNATTHISKSVKDIAFTNADPLNASSIHSYGRNARKLLEEARGKLARTLGVKLGIGEYKIIFTSCGTEANNLVLNNFRDRVVFYSGIEHPSILEVAKTIPNATELKVGRDGVVDLNFLQEQLEKQRNSRIFISVMAANNENGVIQPIKDIVKLSKKYGALVHTDAIQVFGKSELDIKELDVDCATISAHKIGGLPGVGALVVRDNIAISPSFIGGGQERGERSGTENVLGAFCFAVASEEVKKNLSIFIDKMKSLRNYVENEIIKTGFGDIVAKNSPRLPNTVMISSKSLNSDLQLIHLDSMKIAVSSGSACSSGKVKNSQVLKAVGLGAEIYEKVIRVSFGVSNTKEEAEKFVMAWKEMHVKNKE